jgi:tetratricopeptide (TPR) repeat protein
MGPSVRHHFSRIVRSALLKIIFASFLLPVLFSSLSAQTPSRTINIKVAFDEEFYLNSKWKLTLRRVISASSRKFEKHFGIKLKVIDYENWKSDDSLNRVYDLINDLRKKVLLNDCDIVVGFSGQRTRRDDISGAAIYLRNYAVVKRMRSEQATSLVLTHELCHLFGAIDLHEKGSIMDMNNVGMDFDAFTTRLVLLNRNRNFIPHIFPLERGKWDKVITLYKERKRLERKEVDINVMLATFYVEKKECDSAIAECLEFLESYPNSAEIHNLLGIAFRLKGELEKAVEEYRKVLSLQPGIPEIHFNLGIALTKLGRLKRLLTYVRKPLN